MDPNVAAILELLRHQQEQMKVTLETFAKAEVHPHRIAVQSAPKFDQFDSTKEKWEQYLLRLNQHLELHDVTDNDKKRAFLLSCLNPNIFSLLQNLFGDAKVTDQTYTALVEKLSGHFKSAIHVQAARYSFYNCKMQTGQTYPDWVATLRGLAKDCQFICKSNACNHLSFVDDQIRDVLIQHTPHPEVRRQCLIDSNASLEDVLKKAQTYVETLKTDQLLAGNKNDLKKTSIVNKMSATYKKSTANSAKKQNFSKNLWKRCTDCYVKHKRTECPFKDFLCHKCGRKGHLKAVCKSKYIAEQPHSSKTNEIYDQVGSVFSCSRPPENANEQIANVFQRIGKQIWLKSETNGIDMQYQWDTGSTCSMVGEEGYRRLGFPRCHPMTTSLMAYGGKPLKVKGQCFVDVKIGEQVRTKLPLIVVNEKGSNLLGLDWSNSFGLTSRGTSALLDIPNIQYPARPEFLHSNVVQEPKLLTLQQKYNDVFEDKLGKCTKTKVSIHLKDDTKPIFCNARPIPFAVKQKVQDEIDRLVDLGVLQKINYSDWAAPIVVVNKPNGKVRLCGDFKALNRRINVDQHPIPTLDVLLEKLQGGQFYSKIDLADAYLQLELDEDAKKLCVINTPFGLYQYHRMCFGVASSPAQFQRLMDTMISGLPGVAAYLDDLIITGSTETEHWENLERLIQKLSEYGLRVKLDKSVFFQSSVEYLGYIIDKNGKRPSKLSVEAIKNLKRPENVSEIQAFLGKINYYRCFVKNLAEVAQPLYELLKKNCVFKWTSDCESAFQTLKNEVINATQLSHFNPEKPLILATDASNRGIGAVLL